jgi:hypothetical protein
MKALMEEMRKQAVGGIAAKANAGNPRYNQREGRR